MFVLGFFMPTASSHRFRLKTNQKTYIKEENFVTLQITIKIIIIKSVL